MVINVGLTCFLIGGHYVCRGGSRKKLRVVLLWVWLSRPPNLLSCEADGGPAIASYRVLDMHVKFAKQFTHYLILFQELESNKKKLSSEKG